MKESIDSKSGRLYDKISRTTKVKLVLLKSSDKFNEVRCECCNALLFKAVRMSGKLEIKCRRCNQKIEYTFD